MKINPRTRSLNSASSELRTYIHELSEKHDLSVNELMLILTDTTSKLYQVLVRKEHKSEE